MSSTFFHTFLLTLVGLGLVLALAALVLALARLRSGAGRRNQTLAESPREKALHLENISLRRRVDWLERRTTWAGQPLPAFAPDAPTRKQQTASRYE